MTAAPSPELLEEISQDIAKALLNAMLRLTSQQSAADTTARPFKNMPPSRVVLNAKVSQSIAIIVELYGFDIETLKGRNREQATCDARHHLMFLLQTEAKLSSGRIGQILGGRDHSTVLNGVLKHRQKIEDEKFNQQTVTGNHADDATKGQSHDD